MTQETKKITKGSRPQRVPVGQVGKLNVTNQDPNKVYRFVNDRDNRVEMFEQAGWVVEKAADHQIGYRRADSSSAEGTAARISVGLGDHSILMSIDKDWYDEDQIAKAKKIDATEETIKREVREGYKGRFEQTTG
jgi:hypothetical protein